MGNREHAAGRVHRPNRGAFFSCFGACLPPFPPFLPTRRLVGCFPRVCCWSAPHRSSSSAFCVLILRSLPFVSLGGGFVSSAPIDDGGGIVGNVPPLASLVEKRGARSSSLAWGMTTTATGMLLGRGGTPCLVELCDSLAVFVIVFNSVNLYGHVPWRAFPLAIQHKKKKKKKKKKYLRGYQC